MTIRAALLFLATVTAAFPAAAPATFNRDVLPVLQKNCQICHRPGQAAPMSFLTYESTRPWAKAMKQAVLQHKMPPWFADPAAGHFLNDPSLKQTEIDAIVKWADNGAPEGDAKDAPAPVEWPQGWHIKPDVIVKGPTIDVPGKPKNNVVEWITVTIPTGFTEDTWITSVEIKPEFPDVTHHMCVAFMPHKPDVEYFQPKWSDKQRDDQGSALPDKGPTFTGTAAEDCYVPGNPAVDYRSLRAAKLVRAGSDILMNLHYTPNGKDVTDHIQIGFTVTKQAPERRYISFNAGSSRDPKKFAIPPGDPNWQSPPATVTFAQDVELVFMMPHMHSRGKDMTYTLEYPGGKKEVILNVPRYDFNWQLGYLTSIPIPKGTKLRIDAHFDNSPNNKFNPNPNRTVYYGEMTWEEMMLGFFSVVVDSHADTRKILAGPAAESDGA